jgi:peptidoglycan/LPS O-acetylase OafA/YrhL
LDGIRGVAICLVLSWHGFFSASADVPSEHHVAPIAALGRLTWSGVDLFFVLSGFLIGGILLDAVQAERYFASFYIRRAHRILPLYGVVLALAFSLWYVCRHLGASAFWVENDIPLLYYPAFLQNFWMAKHGAFGSYTLAVTWSLAVEEQFYLTLPLIIRYISRSRLWWIVGGMIAGAPLLRIFLNHSVTNGVFASYVLMPCRADALGLGIAAALMKRTPSVWEMIGRLRVYLYVVFGGVTMGVVALLLSRFTPFSNEVFSLEYSLLAVFYFLLLMSVLINRKFETAFSVPALRYMGTIAYGLYLLHFPVMAAVHDLVARTHPAQSGWISPVTSISGISLAIAGAAISWKYLEEPLVKRGQQYGYYRKPEHARGNHLLAQKSGR